MHPKNLSPLALYIHIPWCVKKCPYCDFNSHQASDNLPEEPYINALIEDFEQEWSSIEPRTLETIFIGGGTPSLFQPASYARLLDHIASKAEISNTAEITIEANPGTFELERFKGFRQAGINRISLGIQSFDDTSLKALGRVHNAEEGIRAAIAAREIYERVNLDLMHGLPSQTPAMASADLEQAISLNPDQISWYQLTVEPNTEFHARPPQLPVEEALWEIQEHGQKLLEKAGYLQYEISAYARDGGQGRHNLNYWQFGDYLGIGAGAHGKLSRWRNDKLEIIRRHKQRQPKGYLKLESRLAGTQQVEDADIPFEFMLNALRLTEGVPLSLFAQRTGLAADAIQIALEKGQRQGLLQQNPYQIAPTLEGRLFLNDLITLFMD